MGYLSALLVRHDCLCEIERNTQLGEEISHAVVRFNPHEDSHPVSSGVELITGNIHASFHSVIVIEGNTAFDVGESLRRKGGLPDWSNAEQHLVEIVRRLGYRVIRPRSKK